MTFIQSILSLVASLDLEVEHIDVKSSFLYRDLKNVCEATSGICICKETHGVQMKYM